MMFMLQNHISFLPIPLHSDSRIDFFFPHCVQNGSEMITTLEVSFEPTLSLAALQFQNNCSFQRMTMARRGGPFLTQACSVNVE